ncbi:MAG: cytochrome c [Opitutales bacterium]|nr:cytochrome c [Opitutales bacterium]
MNRIITVVYIFLIILVVSVLGFRGSKSRKEPLYLFPDMDRQARYEPQGENPFFEDKMDDRLPPQNTIARGNALDRAGVFSSGFDATELTDVAFNTGRDEAGEFLKELPIEVNHELMELGRERYDIFCAVCHDETGDGNGAVKNFAPPTLSSANLLTQLYIDQSEGEIYNTISYGKNTMMGYADKLSPKERWAVVLYVRALQRAANATADDIPEAKRGELGL